MFNMDTYCRIKEGAVVSQDFSVYRWENPKLVFKIVTKRDSSMFSLDDKYEELVAAGYGIIDESEGVNLYGNGSLFVKRSDLSFRTSSKEYNEQYKEHVESMKSIKKKEESKVRVNIEFDDNDIKELVTLLKDTKKIANDVMNGYRFDGSADSDTAKYIWSNAGRLYQSSSYLLNLFDEMKLIDKD